MTSKRIADAVIKRGKNRHKPPSVLHIRYINKELFLLIHVNDAGVLKISSA